ncbi:thiamine-phosphate pyrophosphorylase [Paracoccidioides lutzii Pb01]|uniref:Thiamine-phosphate pyrophosphorylase n=1 Tax=Paracoccidioides lutzii (strain ATCC MYA-826 / Pb01) TaxID=502779 RepID=C1GVE2_PARBA|nr:thiamine-phosphate pyrophosphorylase [Paracoccidioides lutzii Pb01]EEH40164.1 thiamine-phosphate pyrophosphorylase [Paracoccidioides lutzii Pb01]
MDLSVYLVTDSTPAILGDRDLCEIVRDAIEGGVTVVQYRDKHSDTGVLIETAKKLHEITKAYNVPLIINDRVDVALAVRAEGVHLGQDDMKIPEAKKLLPPNAYIGATVCSNEEAFRAVEDGADYLGIGTVFATPTKTDTKAIIGTAGTKEILAFLSTMPRKVGTVAIGGINLSNVQRVIYQSQAPLKSLDGAAIVSAIMAAENPKEAAAAFSRLVKETPASATFPAAPRENEVAMLLDEVPNIIRAVALKRPLCHNMINFVVANFAANVAIAIGASPIMSGYGPEASDLAKNGGSLLINMGTLNNEAIDHYIQALRAYNAEGNPVVFDPVGAGASDIRRRAVKQLLAGGYFDVIKGNESELIQVYGKTTWRQVGVDSGPSILSRREKAKLVRDLARRERNVVLLTGRVDYLSDGERVLAIGNGHELLGHITGTGCIIGTMAASFLAVHRNDKLLAVLSSLLLLEIAGERAAAKDGINGPGTFLPALIDELFALKNWAVEWKTSGSAGIDVDAGSMNGNAAAATDENIFRRAAKVHLMQL